jgi:hypothetical protein
MERIALQINGFREAAVMAKELERAGVHSKCERPQAFTNHEPALCFARHIFNLRQFLPECLVIDNPFQNLGQLGEIGRNWKIQMEQEVVPRQPDSQLSMAG